MFIPTDSNADWTAYRGAITFTSKLAMSVS